MAAALNTAGLPAVPSRVFSALLVDDDGRMTAAELGASLGISAAGVSGAVRYLERVGMTRRERVPGSRKDVYVVDDDAWHEAMMRKDVTYGPMVAALQSAIGAVDADDPSLHRLELSREFLLFVDAEMDGLARRWERRKRQLLRQGG